MKKSFAFVKIAALGFAFILSSRAFAFDFGGSVNDLTKFNIQNFKNIGLKQQNTLSLWAKIPFTNSGATYLATEGTFMYQYNSLDLTAGPGNSNLVADLPLLKLNHFQKFSPSSSLQLSAGRFYVSDQSGYVFLQPSDGALVQFTSLRFNAGFYGGYTGLQNAFNVTELNGPGSAYNYKAGFGQLYDFSSPYFVFAGNIGAPYLFLNQSVSLEGVFAMGTKGPNGDNTGYNRGYATLTINGPILGSLFYTLGTTFSTEDFKNLGNLSVLSLAYYFGTFASSISWSAVYASPHFRGITSNTATLAAGDPEYNSLLKTELTGSFKPLSTIFIGLSAGAVFDAPEGTFAYDGVQFALNSRFQAFTDLQVGLSAGQYLGKSEDKTKTTITASAVISF